MSISVITATSLGPYIDKLLQVWRSGKYSKSIIAQAIALAVTGLYLYKILRPPAKLRHLPSVNLFKFAYYFLSHKEASRRVSEVVIPTLRESNAKAYVANFPVCWTINIVDPVAAKALLMKTEYFPKTLTVIDALGESHPLVKFFGRENVVFSNGDVWKSQRKVMNPAFRRAVPIQLFGKLMQKVFEKIDAQQGESVVLIDLFERMTLDALSLGLFAVDFQALSDEESDWVRMYASVRLGLRSTTAFVFPRLESILRYIVPSRRQMAQDVDALNAKLLDMARKRRDEIGAKKLQSNAAKGDDAEVEKDLLTMIMEGELEGVGGLATTEQLRSNLAIFFLAGHDTTANALSFALYNLAAYPDVQEKARQETLRVLGSEPADIRPTAEQCKEFKYIDMVIKENLRLYGPVGQITARKATQDIFLGDLFVPKGADVTIDLDALHRHPDIWQDPERFDPERFADNGESKTHEGLAWIPFSNGGRQCIGMNFSLAEQRVALSMILRKYRITLPADSIHQNGLRIGSATNSAPYDLTVCFEKRY